MNIKTAHQRSQLRKEIKNIHPEAVPFYGPTPAFFAVVGEAPGRKEIEQGRPFVGPAGKLLRSMMEQAEIEPDQAFWTNAVPYLPDQVTPTPAEISRYRPLLERQLRLVRPRFVLLVGGKALSVFKKEQISKARGQLFHLPNRPSPIYFPIYHPAAALRNKDLKPYIRDDLLFFRSILVIDQELGPVTLDDSGQIDVREREPIPS